MRIVTLKRNLLGVFCVGLISAGLACSEAAAPNRTAATPGAANSTTPTPAAARTPAANAADQPAAAAVGFSTDTVCSLPEELSKDSPFAALGGGNWEVWDESDPQLGYGCGGGRDRIKLEDVIAKISAGYSVLGSERAVKVVSATYVALQYGGKTEVEGPLRQKYFDLCDALSRKLTGQMMPDNFRKRLMNEAAYSAEGGEEYTEKVEKGFLSLSTRKDKDALIRLEVNFFPDEAAYRIFKES